MPPGPEARATSRSPPSSGGSRRVPPGRRRRRRSSTEGDEAWRRHWAFQPVGDPTPPPVRRRRLVPQPDRRASSWPASKRRGSSPRPRADRRTLIRRATYDLTGLPPDPRGGRGVRRRPRPGRLSRSWSTACSPRRITASSGPGTGWTWPGTRTPRATSTPARSGSSSTPRPTATGSCGPSTTTCPTTGSSCSRSPPTRRRPAIAPALAAMGFLTLGRRFLGVTHDIIDDRIDVVTRGHDGPDRRLRPVPRPQVRPDPDGRLLLALRRLPELHRAAGADRRAGAPTTRPGVRARSWTKRQKALRTRLASSRAEASQRAREPRGRLPAGPARARASTPRRASTDPRRKDDLIPAFVRRWEAYLAAAAKADDPVFRPWRRFAELCATTSSPAGPPRSTRDLQSDGIARAEPAGGRGRSPSRPRRSARSPSGTASSSPRSIASGRSSRKAAGTGEPRRPLPDPDAEALRQVLYGPALALRGARRGDRQHGVVLRHRHRRRDCGSSRGRWTAG